MKKLAFILFALLIFILASQANAKTYKIAIIDSGIHYSKMIKSPDYKSKIKLCKTGHKNYINGTNNIHDNHGHGTHIAGLIANEIKGVEYCFIIMKVFNVNSGVSYTQAIKDATAMKVDAINISGGGLGREDAECSAIKKATDKGIAVILAAGNEKSEISQYKSSERKLANLNKKYFFPASCDNDKTVVVANGKSKDEVADSSNYGDVVDIYISGNNAYVFGKYMTGTSQSTAIATGGLINAMGNISSEGVNDGKKTITRKKPSK